MTPLVYKIEFPDGRFYIGATKNFTARRQKHLHAKATKRAVNQKVRAAFEAYPVCCIYPIASPLPGVPLHELEAEVLATQQPDLNVNFSPDPIVSGYATARKFGGHASLADFARANKLSYSTLKKQTKGVAFDEWLRAYGAPKYTRVAAKIGPPDPRKDPALTFLDGWVRKRDACVVPWSNYETRRKKGWPEHKALLTPAWTPPVSASSVAKRYGVDSNTYYQRRWAGWTLYEALGLTGRPTPQKPKVKKRLITIDGTTRTLDAWSELTGVPKNSIHQRIHAGWTERQAVGLEPSEKAKKVAEKKAAQDARRQVQASKPPKAPKPAKPHPWDAYVTQLEQIHTPEKSRRLATLILGERGTFS